MRKINIGGAIMAIAVGAAFVAAGCANRQTLKSESNVTGPGEASAGPGTAGAQQIEQQLRDIHFDFNKYDIRSGDGKILKSDAKILRANPAVKVVIEGNCDERGSEQYNLALGERRAVSAEKYLEALGVPKGRLSTVSYGKDKPLDPGHDEKAWAKNRRDDFQAQM